MEGGAEKTHSALSEPKDKLASVKTQSWERYFKPREQHPKDTTWAGAGVQGLMYYDAHRQRCHHILWQASFALGTEGPRCPGQANLLEMLNFCGVGNPGLYFAALNY